MDTGERIVVEPVEVWAHLPRISQAVFEYARVIVTGHVPSATHDVVNVLAQSRALRGFFASSDAELGGRHEVLAGQSQSPSNLRDIWYERSTHATVAAGHC